MPELLQKIEQLKSKFADPATPDTFVVIQGWESAAKKALLVAHAASHEGMQALFKALRGDVSEMNDLLLNAPSDKLSATQRDRVLDRRNLYESFLGFFNQSKETLALVEAEVDKNLKN